MAEIDSNRLRAALDKATAALLAERNARGFWEGELSSSALSTATAVTALAVALKHGSNPQSPILNPQSSISGGLKWLAANQNADGGWGDTTKSLSNISTTTLCWAAFGAAGADEMFANIVGNAERWLEEHVRVHHPANDAGGNARAASGAGVDSPRSARLSTLPAAIIARYGKDRTFSVPILTMCALAGRLGEGRAAWEHIIPLPFELAACPHQLFAALRLPVVSYALPALIAIGQARHVHAPSRNPFARLVRMATRGMTLRKLTKIQPSNGGFLEATPLTSFVTMSLASSGQAQHVVTQRGLEFLLKSQRPDGSWPIDTNLATWCTTLAIDALPQSAICNPQSAIDWLLRQQHTTEHPYTHTAPGGWAWTDLPGGVPDADDTAGALLALHKLLPRSSRREKAPSEIEGIDQSLLTSAATRRDELARAAEPGLRWLLDLQNHDGGIPTFCRGWGALPFDRSSADITAHVIRAWLAWKEDMPHLEKRLHKAIWRAVAFLFSTARPDGSWIPLWFGNQSNAGDENPVYGTARVVFALAQIHQSVALERGVEWLSKAQQADGGWGGSARPNSSVEETSLAVHALAESLKAMSDADLRAAATNGINRGVEWLLARIDSGEWTKPAPIGFYFAKLWYFERLYPVIFTVGALRAVLAVEHLDSAQTG